MRQYKEITATNYCLQKLKCRCNACSFEFIEYIPLNYELVCFIDEFGEKYYLPTHGEYGYLDLLEKIVEGWKPDKDITNKVSEKFEKKFAEITPYSLSLFQKIKCPVCSREDITVIRRETIENYPINWIKIDTENI